MKVAVIMGGTSAERAVSLRSGEAVLTALKTRHIQAFSVDGVEALLRLKPEDYDVVFNILHGEAGENGELAGLLSCLNIPFTGCDITGAVLSWDKNIAKTLVKAKGLKTPFALLLTQNSDLTQLNDLGTGPWIVKPTQEGSSVALYYTKNSTELNKIVKQSLQVVDSILIEEFIEGTECTVAVVKDKVLPVIKIQPAVGFYDYKAKYENIDTQYFCPSGFDEKLENALKQDAKIAFDALSLRGWGRIDFIVDDKGNRWFLEANTTPGMTATSLVPKAAAAIGWDFAELVQQILSTAINNKHRRNLHV